MFILIVFFLFFSLLIYFKIAEHYNIVDEPNYRSSHKYRTIRGGGIIFYLAVFMYFLFYGLSYPQFALGLTLIAIISFLDDIKTLDSKLRLLIHFSSILLMLYDCGIFSLPWYYALIALIVSTGIINAYNFMDGINGMTGGYSLVLMASFWYINNYIFHFIDNIFIFVISSSLLIFIIYNFRNRAKCFAGDVGSVSIAFINVFLLSKLIIDTQDWSYLIILILYGVDTILTILHRIILKENIFKAHRKHMYQIMSNELHFSHIYVSVIYIIIQTIIMFGYFLFRSYSILYFLCSAILLSLFYILFMKRYYKLHSK